MTHEIYLHINVRSTLQVTEHVSPWFHNGVILSIPISCHLRNRTDRAATAEFLRSSFPPGTGYPAAVSMTLPSWRQALDSWRIACPPRYFTWSGYHGDQRGLHANSKLCHSQRPRSSHGQGMTSPVTIAWLKKQPVRWPSWQREIHHRSAAAALSGEVAFRGRLKRRVSVHVDDAGLAQQLGGQGERGRHAPRVLGRHRDDSATGGRVVRADRERRAGSKLRTGHDGRFKIPRSVHCQHAELHQSAEAETIGLMAMP